MLRTPLLSAAALVAAVTVVGTQAPTTPPAPKVTVLRAARVIDVERGEVLTGQQVVVEERQRQQNTRRSADGGEPPQPGTLEPPAP